MKKNHLLIILCLLVFIVGVILQNHSAQQQRQSGVHIFNNKALGLSLAKSYLEDQLHLNKQAFHRAEDLARFDLVVVHNPKLSLSQFETAVLKNYVLAGGTLWLYALNPKEFSHLNASLLEINNLTDDGSVYKMQQNTSFKNKKTQSIHWPEFNHVQHYGAHHFVKVSAKELSKQQSEQQDFEDHQQDQPVLPGQTILRWQMGAGSVVLYAGVPPYVNTMLLSHPENQQFLRQIKHTYPKISWDVYHHFIQQAGFKDFIQDIQVTVPMACFLIFLMLYFFYAPKKVQLKHDENHQVKIPTYHHFYQGLIQQAFTQGAGREQAFAYFNEQSSKLLGLKKSHFVQHSDMNEDELKIRWKKKLKELQAYFQKRS